MTSQKSQVIVPNWSFSTVKHNRVVFKSVERELRSSVMILKTRAKTATKTRKPEQNLLEQNPEGFQTSSTSKQGCVFNQEVTSRAVLLI